MPERNGRHAGGAESVYLGYGYLERVIISGKERRNFLRHVHLHTWYRQVRARGPFCVPAPCQATVAKAGLGGRVGMRERWSAGRLPLTSLARHSSSSHFFIFSPSALVVSFTFCSFSSIAPCRPIVGGKSGWVGGWVGGWVQSEWKRETERKIERKGNWGEVIGKQYYLKSNRQECIREATSIFFFATWDSSRHLLTAKLSNTGKQKIKWKECKQARK